MVGDAPQYWTKKPSQLWTDVFKLRRTYNLQNYKDVKHPTKEMLWFNSNIKIDNKIVYLKEMHKKGIENISDLVSSTKTFIHSNNSKKYRVKMSFLKYHSLIHAIPSAYKEQIKAIRNVQPQNTFTVDRIMKEE